MRPGIATAVRALYLLFGIALLWLAARSVDLEEVGQAVWAFGAVGLTVVVAIYAVEFLCDTVSWQLTLPRLPITARWTARLFSTRLVGEALNTITPLAGMGGEPVKAALLKHRFGVPLTDSAASIVLAKTVSLLSLILFLGAGFILVANDARLDSAYKVVAGVGLGTLTFATVLFFVVQRYRLSTTLGRRLGRHRVSARLAKAMLAVEAFDDALVQFYVHSGRRFAIAFGFSFANWVVGVLGTWATFQFLETPLSFRDAWVMESVAQLVRAGTFFIPASLGAQEGAFVVISGALTGSPAAGLAAALVRRLRELLWIALGVGAGYAVSVPKRPEANDRAR